MADSFSPVRIIYCLKVFFKEVYGLISDEILVLMTIEVE